MQSNFKAAALAVVPIIWPVQSPDEIRATARVQVSVTAGF